MTKKKPPEKTGEDAAHESRVREAFDSFLDGRSEGLDTHGQGFARPDARRGRAPRPRRPARASDRGEGAPRLALPASSPRTRLSRISWTSSRSGASDRPPLIERSPAPPRGPAPPAALLPALACAPAPPPPAGASAAPSARASRAVLLSFDGVSGERLSKLLAEGQAAARRLPARRRPRPLRAALDPAEPVVDRGVPRHARDGRAPREDGHRRQLDARPKQAVRDEALRLRRADPRRDALAGGAAAGKAASRSSSIRGATAGRPSAGGISEWPGSYDFGSDPRLETIGASRWGEAKESVPSFSPPRSLRLALLSTAHAFSVTALDTTDDGRTNYDRVRVQGEAGPPVEAREGEWFPVEVAGEPSRTGAWCKVLRLAPDLSETKIYVGALNSNRAYPEEFRRELDRRVGFWPGRPDDGSLGADTPWEQSFREQADRIADFLTRATILVLDRRTGTCSSPISRRWTSSPTSSF